MIYHGCPCCLPVRAPGPGSAAVVGGAGCPAEAPQGRDACERRQGEEGACELPLHRLCAVGSRGQNRAGRTSPCGQNAWLHILQFPAPCAVAVPSTAVPSAVGCHGRMQWWAASIGAVPPHHRAAAGFAELICPCPCPAVALPDRAATWPCGSHCRRK